MRVPLLILATAVLPAAAPAATLFGEDFQSFDVAATAATTTPDFPSTRPSIPSFQGPVLDNVSVTTADPVGGVPGPATRASMTIGFGLLGAAGRRRALPAGRLA